MNCDPQEVLLISFPELPHFDSAAWSKKLNSNIFPLTLGDIYRESGLLRSPGHYVGLTDTLTLSSATNPPIEVMDHAMTRRIQFVAYCATIQK